MRRKEKRVNFKTRHTLNSSENNVGTCKKFVEFNTKSFLQFLFYAVMPSTAASLALAGML
jgi:hypothetical protein